MASADSAQDVCSQMLRGGSFNRLFHGSLMTQVIFHQASASPELLKVELRGCRTPSSSASQETPGCFCSEISDRSHLGEIATVTTAVNIAMSYQHKPNTSSKGSVGGRCAFIFLSPLSHREAEWEPDVRQRLWIRVAAGGDRTG